MSTHQNPLNLRPGMALAQRMLATGSAPDLILQAIDEGLFEGVDLNATFDSSPLSEMWARRAKHFDLGSYVAKLGVVPELAWSVDSDPSSIELSDKTRKGWADEAAKALWEEHAGIRLVQSGMDPLQPWSNKGKGWLSHYDNLLDWAAKTNRPWLLRACLESLPEHSREWEVGRVVHVSDAEDEPMVSTRLHEAMGHSLPLVAEVWREHGADINARDAIGQTPVFLARSRHALQWALKHGASLADVSDKGTSPKDGWRETSTSTEEWAAMQEEANLSGGEMLALLGKTVSRADFEGLKESFPNLKDTAQASFPGGRTLIGYAAHEFLLQNVISPSRDRWRKSMNKILHFLWTRVDLEGAHANQSNPYLTDREVAWTASMVLGGLAGRAATNAQKKHGFPKPSLEKILQWGKHAFSTEHAPTHSRPWARLRDWVISTAGRRLAGGDMDDAESARLIKTLNDTAETYSSSLGEERDTASLAVTSIVREREGTIRMDQETKDRFLAELIRTACRAISGDDYTSGNFTGGTSQTPSLSGFRNAIQIMRAQSAFSDDRDYSLASCITAFLDMGATLPDGEYEGLVEHMEDARFTEHPVFREIEPLFAFCREKEMERKLAQEAPATRTAVKIRF